MGACSFQNRGRGKSAQDVFTNLQENAISEYGYDSYNGTISTVPGFRDVTNEWKNSKKDIRQFINDKLDDSGKRDCFCICTRPPVANTNKTKTQVEHIVSKGTKKWILRYVVYAGWSDKFIVGFDKKGDAVKRAREHTEKTQESTYIKMEKVLDKGSCVVAKINYKKSTSEKDGEYVFFGWAAE